jgi:hypothetical protein
MTTSLQTTQALAQRVKASLKNVGFYHVSEVVASADLHYEYVTPVITHPERIISYELYPGQVDELSNKDREQHVVEFAQDFDFATSALNIRADSDSRYASSIQEKIYGNIATNYEIDMMALLMLDECPKGFIPLIPGRYCVPRVGDLVCGCVEVDPQTKQKYFAFWFICTRQFMNFWTGIIHDSHPTFGKDPTTRDGLIPKDDARIRKVFFSGSHLATNAYWKNLVCNPDSKPDFYVSRCERAADDPHFYPALMLLLRYNEYPSANSPPTIANIPAKCWLFGRLSELYAKLNCV